MLKHRWPGHHRARALGVALLILSLTHAPLPRADFHNVRHHDAPGQVCEFHHHLLRWHPDAGRSADVAVLHWHWMPPWSSPDDPGHTGPGPALHADLSGTEATWPEPGPVVAPDLTSRPLVAAAPILPASLDLTIASPPGDGRGPRVGLIGPVHGFAATFAPRASLAAWLQRWSC